MALLSSLIWQKNTTTKPMESKQTAVEYLEQEFKKFLNWQTFSMQYRGIQQDIKQVPYFDANDFTKAIEEAKKMEEAQIKSAHVEGFGDAHDWPDKRNADEYYNQTYNKQ